ncbi:MAG: hypothetical protein ACTSRA_18885 [Promethearchaeota archaeon]
MKIPAQFIKQARRFIEEVKKRTNVNEIKIRVKKIIDGLIRDAWYRVDFNNIENYRDYIQELIKKQCIEKRLIERVDRGGLKLVDIDDFANKFTAYFIDFSKQVKKEQDLKRILEIILALIKAEKYLR